MAFYGNGGRSINRMNYAKCVDALNTARSKADGKPLPGGIRIFARDTHMAVRQWNTDIVRYYPDGSFEICTGWDSQTTLCAIHSLTGKNVTYHDLPLFNNRKSGTVRHRAIDKMVFNSVGDYLRFGPDGKIDMSTVKPIDVEIITNTKIVAAYRKRVIAFGQQLTLRRKLGIPSNRYQMDTGKWVRWNIDRPLIDVNFEDGPETFHVDGISPFEMARMAGATETIQFKEFA